MLGAETCTSLTGKPFRKLILLFSQAGLQGANCRYQWPKGPPAFEMLRSKGNDPSIKNLLISASVSLIWTAVRKLSNWLLPRLYGNRVEETAQSEETLYKLFLVSKPHLLTKPWFPAMFYFRPLSPVPGAISCNPTSIFSFFVTSMIVLFYFCFVFPVSIGRGVWKSMCGDQGTSLWETLYILRISAAFCLNKIPLKLRL